MVKEKFNESEFIKREYELLRYITSVDGKFSEEAIKTFDSVKEELLVDEEYLNYAINVSEDIFGIKQLNGVVTTAIMLLNLEKINPDISEKLMDTLLFKYQSKENYVPLILTGEKVFKTTYLEYLLTNTEYKLEEKYNTRISMYVVQSIQKQFNEWLLTLYFVREDIPIKYKKFVIDSLDEDVLYRLTNKWEESFTEYMMDSLDVAFFAMDDEQLDELEEEFENKREERDKALTEVITLINEKLYV